MAETSNETASKRAAKCDRTFINGANEEAARASTDTVAVKFYFVETGETLMMPLDDLPPDVLRAAAAFGINTSVGNTFGGITDPAEAFEVAETRWEVLKAGSWSAERQAGPRTSDFLEAVARFRQENGKDISDSWRDRFKAQLANNEINVKEKLDDPTIKAHFFAVKRERAEERAKKAAEAAKGTPSATATSLLD